jgi:hypothetical protein
MDSAAEEPRFHRRGQSSAFGKLDDRIEAHAVESSVKVKLVELAAAEGLPLAEFQREIYRVVAFGPDHIKKIHTERVDRIAKKLGLEPGE